MVPLLLMILAQLGKCQTSIAHEQFIQVKMMKIVKKFLLHVII